MATLFTIIFIIVGMLGFSKCSDYFKKVKDISNNLTFDFIKYSSIHLLFSIFIIGNNYLLDQIARDECSINGWKYNLFPWHKFIFLSLFFLTYFVNFTLYYVKRAQKKNNKINDNNKENIQMTYARELDVFRFSFYFICYLILVIENITKIDYSAKFLNVIGSLATSFLFPIVLFIASALIIGTLCTAILISFLPAKFLTRVVIKLCKK
jgi:hypothetical protein